MKTLRISAIIFLAACGFTRPGSLFAQQPSHSAPPSPSSTPSAAPSSAPQRDEAASSSLLVNVPITIPANTPITEAPHALRLVSMFAIVPPKPHTFQQHDLVQIIVREASQATSSQDLNTKKDNKYNGKVPHWPDFNLHDLLNFQIEAGKSADTPELEVDFTKDFKGKGDYERKDDLTARLTAEVIEVLPNGNLVLEARTHIKTDDEEATMKVTGICRPDDITAANTLLSNQVFDLSIEKMHQGELRKNAQKGILAKVLETVFAF